METYKEFKKDLKKLYQIFSILLLLIIFLTSFNMDNSDEGYFNRSGLALHTDHLTGLQYFSSGSGLTPRLDKNGNQIRIKNDTNK